MTHFHSTEPIFHHFDDCFPDDHKLAYETTYCVNCHGMVHCGNNETMQAWFETGIGAVCLTCFWLSYWQRFERGNATRYIEPRTDTAPDFDRLGMSRSDE